MTSQGAETVNLIDQHIDLMDTDEFRILKAALWEMEICTSLSDSQAESRANLIPPRRNMLWAIIADDTISCYHNRQTHRHMIMAAVTL